METLAVIGAYVTLAGSLFILFAAIGLVRMPDIYNRIQAGAKATTLGTILSLLGIGLITPGWMLKLLLIIVFILITNPLSSHVLGRAAHYIKTPLSGKTATDHLEEDQKAETKSTEKGGRQ
jgi:multicomponent Na+:H+ antiporter subunit G